MEHEVATSIRRRDTIRCLVEFGNDNDNCSDEDTGRSAEPLLRASFFFHSFFFSFLDWQVQARCVLLCRTYHILPELTNNTEDSVIRRITIFFWIYPHSTSLFVCSLHPTQACKVLRTGVGFTVHPRHRTDIYQQNVKSRKTCYNLTEYGGTE